MSSRKRCSAITCQESRCKLSCSSGYIYCNTHLRMCKNLLKGYKKVCGNVWSKKCLRNTSTESLNQIIELSQKCARLREGFSAKCCKGRTDNGHLGAIRKMMRLAESCKKEKERRKK